MPWAKGRKEKNRVRPMGNVIRNISCIFIAHDYQTNVVGIERTIPPFELNSVQTHDKGL